MLAGHYGRWLVALVAFALGSIVHYSIANLQNAAEEKTTFEAAFQGRCDHGSPCEHVCYELHDGMYECDCREGFVLHKNGYSCDELNGTSVAKTNLQDIIRSEDNEISQDKDYPSDNEYATEKDVLYMRGASLTIHLESLKNESVNSSKKSTKKTLYQSYKTPKDGLTGTVESGKNSKFSKQNPAQLNQRSQSSISGSSTVSSIAIVTEPSCTLDCGPGGTCYIERQSAASLDSYLGNNDNNSSKSLTRSRQQQQQQRNTFLQRCQCPIGRGGDKCQQELEIKSPRFTGLSWLAFPALRAAYKHVQLELEFRPESWDGILLLAGERDDLQGDFMAVIVHHGYVELRFDCGSGVGIVRSSETVKLNAWNTLSIYRHRWDAWMQLNHNKRVKGRSKGLFSRITFREPLFIGGAGNTTGLDRLPVANGFRGCIRNLEVNEHRYRFPLSPRGDSIDGFDVDQCTADRCSKVPCSHGGKCLTTGGDTAICLCPLGYTGDLCETRLELQVPSFNGSSYLRYPGLADSSLSWLELTVILKPLANDGVILYNGHHSDATGDFIALYLASGYVQFTFDLGTGCATLRSNSPVKLGDWIEVRISRTGRLASLEVENGPPQEILAPGGFTQLSLPLNLYLGGAPSPDMYSTKMKTKANFVGCIQTVVINGREIGILAEALGGVNIGNCRHACEARPCGEAECRPFRERFTCRCLPGLPHPCPALTNFEDKPTKETLAPTASPYFHMSTKSLFFNSENIPSFTGTDSYLHYESEDVAKRIRDFKVDINMRFRTSSKNGLLLWSAAKLKRQKSQKVSEFLALGLENGYLTFSYDLGSGETELRYNLTRLDDDLWHRVHAVRNEQRAFLVVDNGNGVFLEYPSSQLRQLNRNLGLYIGGAPNVALTTGGRYEKGIAGCISDLVLDSDYSVALAAPSESKNTYTCVP